jgi:transcriptional regulator with XRE-family HTH domain
MALIDLRRRAGLTQMQVAVAVGTTPPQVSMWERGKITPSTAHLRPLAQILGVSLEELLDALDESRQSSLRSGGESADE